MTVIQKLYFSSGYLQVRLNFLLLPVLMQGFPIKFPSQFCSKFWLISMLYGISSQVFTIKLCFNYKHMLGSFWKIAPCKRV